jgi:hypothetical protein
MIRLPRMSDLRGAAARVVHVELCKWLVVGARLGACFPRVRDGAALGANPRNTAETPRVLPVAIAAGRWHAGCKSPRHKVSLPEGLYK